MSNDIKLDKKTSLTTPLSITAALIVIVWALAGKYNDNQHNMQTVTQQVSDHTIQLSNVQITIATMQKDLSSVSANQAAQLEIIKYIARDRRGPVPEALNK